MKKNFEKKITLKKNKTDIIKVSVIYSGLEPGTSRT